MPRAQLSDDTGILVSPPDGRRRERTHAAGRRRWIRWGLPVVGTLVAVAAGGFFAHRALAGGGEKVHDPLTLARADADAQRRVAADASARAAALETELAAARAALAEHEKALAAKEAESSSLEKKLAGLVGADGSVTRDGEEIKLELVDKVLFDLGEAELTPRGEVVLYEVGEALKTVPDKQIWVQGHTDTTPIRAAKGVVPKFASNWELSAARALTVVHYLQDEAKLDPRRLAAVAFGQHRPASKAKAKNRRIEIVLYPKHKIDRR
jgi:chemotaxis protein MotB